MTEKEYFDKIKKIQQQISSRNFYEALQALEDLYSIRPIRKEWFFAKLEVMFGLQYPQQEIVSLLDSLVSLPYVSEDTEHIFSFYVRIFMQTDPIESDRYRFLADLYKLQETGYSSHHEQLSMNLVKQRENFLSEQYTDDDLNSLADAYYSMHNMYMYLIVALLQKHKVGSKALRRGLQKLVNIGFLTRYIEDNNTHSFIVIEDEHCDVDCSVIAKVLVELGQTVFFIKKPIACSIENEIAMDDTLPISLDNQYIENKITVLPAIELVRNGEFIGNNVAILLAYIKENLLEDSLALVLCSGLLLDSLTLTPLVQKNIRRLDQFQADFLNRNLAFGWFGDYLQYIGYLYEMDAYKAVHAEPQCDFSIVIPARNSAITLKSTIQTCLNQRFKGSYEIIVSDNSSLGNTEVYDMCCELKDARIRYIKTPIELLLAKSFEFAYLHTRGKFIFSIGSDDAVLPWALEILEQVLPTIPDSEILCWERGFYAWPGFNQGQENQFIIPLCYKKNQINIEFIDGKKALNSVLANPQAMYNLPLLYINSGFRRSYLKTLLNKTGAILDGRSQDIYMGVVNTIINDNYPFIYYPLTIAGMSELSLGALGTKIMKYDTKNQMKHKASLSTIVNMNGNAVSFFERIVPDYKYDTVAFYWAFFRNMNNGNIKSEELNNFDWRAMILNIARQLNADNEFFVKQLDCMRYSAKLIDNDMVDFLEKNIVGKLLEPRIKSEVCYYKVYKEGFENGGLTLDASKFGVTNSAEAVILFENITGL